MSCGLTPAPLSYTGGSVGGGGATPAYTVANFAALPADATVGQRVGVTAQSGFTSVVVVNTGANAWNLESGVIATSANLPSDPAYNSGGITVSLVAGSLLYGSTSTEGWRWSGSAWVNLEPVLTVATFSLLPASCEVGHRVSVTGESGLTGVVVVNTAPNTWSLETVTCAETAIPALGATADTWYSSGGITVTAADGAWLYDSTYGRALRWWPAASLACDGAWIPSEVYARGSRVLDGWLEGTESNTGLAATLLAQGVTAATTAGGGASSIDTTTTAGYLSLISTNPGAGASAVTVLGVDPGAGFTSTSWGYFRAIMRLSTFTGNAASCTLSVIYDGTDRYDFAVVRSGGSITVDGAFVDASGSPMTRLAAQAAGDNDARTADVLLEMLKRGTRCMVRFNGGTWTTLDGATAIASASKLFQVRATAENNGATACTLRLKRAIWMHA